MARQPRKPVRRRRVARDEHAIMEAYEKLEKAAMPMVKALTEEAVELAETLEEVTKRDEDPGDGTALMLTMDDPPLEDMYSAIKRMATQFHHLRKIKVEVNKLNRETLALEGVDDPNELPYGYYEWPKGG